MYSLQNNLLKITVNQTGAELCDISSIKNKTNFMWDANPDIWGSFAPNLFPVIGSLKNDHILIDNKPYAIPKHGFVRRNSDITLEKQSDDELVFNLKYNTELLKIYPYKFDFKIAFKLQDNTLTVSHYIENLDNKTMYFSVGGHPAFKCPVFKDEAYTDYYLEFEHEETAESYVLNMEKGLITDQTFSIISNQNTIPLRYDLFNNDALIFKALSSRKVSLKSKNHGNILAVRYPDFPYLGIWAKPNANYVCIEPWLGIADHENHNLDFTQKEGIQQLAPSKVFQASYSIEIDPKHLV
ncbi:aldose 1-epimerase family protein [Formosa sp. A9]|uniref:aldose 1-epimerase family protein n=1 Tax=Formosa sp. A9 TaxID=3442641 RepID=UPI003EB92DBC